MYGSWNARLPPPLLRGRFTMTLSKACFAPLLLLTLVPHACANPEPINNDVLDAVDDGATEPTSPTSPSPMGTPIPTSIATPNPPGVPTPTMSENPPSPPASSTDPGPVPTPIDTAPPVPTPTQTTPPTPTVTSTATGSGGAPPVPSGAGGMGGELPENCELPSGDVPQALLDNTKVQLLYITDDQNVMGNVQFRIQITNQSTMTLALGDVTVRYWLTIEEDVPYELVTDQIANGVTGAEISIEQTTDGRDYVLIQYPDKDMIIGTNPDTTTIAVRLQTSNPQFDKSNDWSWMPAEAGQQNGFRENPNMTVYFRGALLSGEEPPCIVPEPEVPDAGVSADAGAVVDPVVDASL